MTYPGIGSGGSSGGGISYPSTPISRGIGGTAVMSDAGIKQMLKTKGVSPAEIAAFFATGKPTVSITRILAPAQIQQIGTSVQAARRGVVAPVSNGGVGGTPVKKGILQQATPVTGGDRAPQPVKQGVLRQGTPITQVGGKINGSTGGVPLNQSQGRVLSGGSANPKQTLLNGLIQALKTRQRVVGAYGDAARGQSTQAAAAQESSLAKKQALLDKINSAVSNANRIVGVYTDARDAQNAAGVDAGGLGEFPTGGGADTYTAPEISMRDFSDQANQLASEAYGPLFQAIAQGKTNAQGQYNTSDTVVKGLYDKLVSDTQAAGVQQGQQYDQASAEAAARSKALQDRQGQVYGDTANTQTALLERLGQQQSAPQVIAGGLQEQAFQQSQAAQQGDAQQQYYQAGKQNSNDYTTGIANAQNTQGTVAREGLVRDLATVLSQFDSQAASGKTQQATTALDLANQLSSRDLQVQTANASNDMGAAQLNQSAQAQALAAQQAAYQNAYGQQRDARSDFESDRNYGLQENQFKLDAASAQAKAQGAAGSAGTGAYVPIGEDGFNSQSGPQQVTAQAESIDPGRGQDYLGLFDAAVRTFDLSTNPSSFDFANRAAELAKQHGLSPAAAFAAATTYWKQIMNRN